MPIYELLVVVGGLGGVGLAVLAFVYAMMNKLEVCRTVGVLSIAFTAIAILGILARETGL